MKNFRRIKPYLKPFIWMIVASALLAVMLAAIRAVPALLIQKVIDQVMVEKNPRLLYVFAGGFVGLYVLNFAIRFGHYFLMRIVVTRVDQQLKNDLYDHLLGLSTEYFTERSTGSLISRVSLDPNAVVNGVAATGSLVREPLTFVFLLSYAFYLNWKLTLLTFLIFPPLAWVFGSTGRNLKRYILGIADQNAELISALQESLSGIRTVKAFQLESYVRNRFRNSTHRYAALLLKSAILEEASHPFVELLTALIVAAVIFYGGSLIIAGELTPGELIGFFGAFALMMQPLRAMNDVNIKLSQASGALDRIYEVFGWTSRLKDPPQPLPVRALENEIRFENVSFSYPDAPKQEVLSGISFSIPKGSTIALAGQSGSGKSSIVSLLPRMFDVTHGKILMDGMDIRKFKIDDLRKQIAIVSQDVFLFNDTIEENIRCGKLDATPEQIRAAARHAHADEFIAKLPEGFATVIGDRGVKLSGGERQRISIARAFLREAPILILDEATSSLDTKSEKAVQAALEKLMVGRTTLVVAHRLSTIRDADQILVMKDGRIVERGKHEELVKLSGEYARFTLAGH